MAEEALAKLLEKDGRSGSTGAKYLAALERERDKGKGNGKGRKENDRNGREEDGEERKRPFSASAIKRIGFDPTSRHGAREGEDAARRVSSCHSVGCECVLMRMLGSLRRSHR